MTYPEGYSKNPCGTKIANVVWEHLKESNIKELVQTQWKSLKINYMGWDEFQKLYQNQHWMQGTTVASLFLMFAAIPPKWDGNAQTLIRNGLIAEEEYINCSGLVFYFIQTGKLDKRFFTPKEFYELYPDLKRILTAAGNTLSDDFSRWLYEAISQGSKHIAVPRYIEVVIGLCHMAGLLFQHGSDKLDKEGFHALVKQGTGLGNRQSKEILKLMIKARNQPFSNELTFEEIFKYVVSLDNMLRKQ